MVTHATVEMPVPVVRALAPPKYRQSMQITGDIAVYDSKY